MFQTECKALLRAQGFDWVDAWYDSNINTEATFNHNPERMVSRAQHFIGDAQAQQRPVFLYFSSTLIHCTDTKTSMLEFSLLQTPFGLLSEDEASDDTAMRSREELWAQASEGAANDLAANARAK